MFNAIVIEKDDAGYRAGLTPLEDAQLPSGDVLVRVDYSTLNYKDGLAITGQGPVVRQFPMVPGIDLAGTVEHSRHAGFRVGDRVLLNGWGRRRKALGRTGAKSPRERRLADPAAGRARCPGGHGVRHGGLYRHVVGIGVTAPRYHAGQR
ncbi:hypothetical protein NVIRENTERO_02087 [Sodalis praecaptivus]|nr:hypothetical protein NVIRENTERO_02087 [Sodalis praecaptivus]